MGGFGLTHGNHTIVHSRVEKRTNSANNKTKDIIPIQAIIVKTSTPTESSTLEYQCDQTVAEGHVSIVTNWLAKMVFVYILSVDMP